MIWPEIMITQFFHKDANFSKVGRKEKGKEKKKQLSFSWSEKRNLMKGGMITIWNEGGLESSLVKVSFVNGSSVKLERNWD